MRMGRELMGMRRHLVNRQGVGLGATYLPQIIVRKARPLPRAIGDATAQVGQGKGGLTVAAEGGAEE